VAAPVRDGSGRAHAGLLSAHDLAAYEGRIEEPVHARYRGAEVWKCLPWSQGPVFLQQLRLLEGFDLAAMGAASADALHVWAECAKLAFADREAVYADPLFEKVPLERLLSDDYTEERRALVDPRQASLEQRPGIGRLPAGWPLLAPGAAAEAEPQALAAALGRRDTTQLVAADAAGNLVSATPSGGWVPSSPVIPELGFPLGTRAQMFVLDSGHPNALAPGKRPRTTLTPSIALRDGRPYMAFGTPGGDQQDQWSLVMFLRHVHHVMNLQEAIDAPAFHTAHFESSFWPRDAKPGQVTIEGRFGVQVMQELARRGHQLEIADDWSEGNLSAIARDEDGTLHAAANPRYQEGYAVAR
jgi:gamma-glutamyltranspeptidase/glutathione hydrolase